MTMTQRKCRAGIRRASEEGRGADQCERADRVGRGTERGEKGDGERRGGEGGGGTNKNQMVCYKLEPEPAQESSSSSVSRIVQTWLFPE